jgi:hypothetical protein
MAARYLLMMLAGALAAAASTAAVVWVMDPLGIYGSHRIEGVNALKPALKTRSRIFKTVEAASGRWEALIVGTSRADSAIDPHHAFFGGARCFNAAMSGQSLSESLALVRAAAQDGKLRHVLAVLDFEVANGYYEGAPDFVAANYRPWRRITLAMNMQMLALAAEMPLMQEREVVLRDDALWLPDGRYVYPPPRNGHRAATLWSEAEYIQKSFFRGPERRFALATAASQPLEAVRELVRLAHARRIELTLAMSPVHARQLETIAAAGLGGASEDWKRSLVAINEEEARLAGRKPFPLWDFWAYNAVTTEAFPALGDPRPMRWHFESSHYTPATGELMLERMAGRGPRDFGTILDSSNIEAQIGAMRNARLQWRAGNPADVAEVEGIARRLMPPRSRGGAT